MKQEIRVLGIDDSPFTFNQKNVLVVATFFRGGKLLDGVLSTTVEKDGTNSTTALVSMIEGSRFKPHLQAIILDGIALAGFNVVDIGLINSLTKIPVIVVMRNYPDKKKMYSALKKIGHDQKIGVIRRAGKIYKHNEIYFQSVGIAKKEAQDILDLTCTNSNIPEPVRVAHLIAAGIVKGESKARA